MSGGRGPQLPDLHLHLPHLHLIRKSELFHVTPLVHNKGRVNCAGAIVGRYVSRSEDRSGDKDRWLQIVIDTITLGGPRSIPRPQGYSDNSPVTRYVSVQIHICTGVVITKQAGIAQPRQAGPLI